MNPINKLTHNAKILRWLASLDPESLSLAVDFYADYLDCPKDEINPEFSDPESLEWLWRNFRAQIEDFDIFNT